MSWREVLDNERSSSETKAGMEGEIGKGERRGDEVKGKAFVLKVLKSRRRGLHNTLET